MTEKKALAEESFLEFNQSREMLAKQFHELLYMVGNHVFHGEMNPNNPNILEEIHRQSNWSEAEKNVLRHLYFYSSHLQSSRFLLGVLGRFKSGKSTLLNALAGANISPMDTRISTGILNFTYWNPTEECKVIYDSGQEMVISPDEKALYVDYRQNPDNEKAVHSVRHGSPKLDLQHEIIFVDTPGLEAVNRIHEQITLDFVAQCHAAIVVSAYPPFGSTELEFYERIKATIPNVFLIQNLPSDKLVDWVKLEAQTLENLHKMGFYKLDSATYGQTEVRSILNKIADSGDEKALQKFKNIHQIHLYSVNAKDAYEALFSTTSASSTASHMLEQSRLLLFKSDLYDFLARHKGSALIADYLQKGKVVLAELVRMVETRQKLLLKSLDEIEKEIQENEYKRQKAHSVVEMLVDRANLKMVESFKNFKNQIVEKDLQELLEELDRTYGEMNIFRLRKPQIKKIKARVGEFNRVFGMRFQQCRQSMQAIVQETEEKIMQSMENHGMFNKLEMNASCSNLSIGEIAGAGYLEYGFSIAFHGGITYIVGSLAGGSGIALLGAGFWPIFIGSAIGLSLSVPLAKYCAPAIEYTKNLLSKFVGSPTHSIFQNFRNNVREKIEEIERNLLDTSVTGFKDQVLKNIEEYFQLFAQKMEELKSKKAHGMTQKDCEMECKKLEGIVAELHKVEAEIDPSQPQAPVEAAPKVQGLLQGVKGYLKKFKT